MKSNWQKLKISRYLRLSVGDTEAFAFALQFAKRGVLDFVLSNAANFFALFHVMTHAILLAQSVRFDEIFGWRVHVDAARIVQKGSAKNLVSIWK